MRTLLALLLALVAAPSALAQQPAPPSDESLRQLFEVTHVSRMIDAYMGNVDAGMQAGIKAALRDHKPNARQQQIIDDMRARIVRAMRETLTWQKLQPLFLDIYRHNFTQQEVDDMLTFYRTPSGRSVLEKLPATIQQAGQAVQGMLPALLQQLQGIEKDSMAQLKAAEEQ